MVVNSRGEHVGNEVGIFLVDKQREGQWLLGDESAQRWMKIAQFANIEVVKVFLFSLKIGRWDDDADTNNLLIERDEPCPVELARIEYQRVVFVLVSSRALIAHSVDDLREDGDLLIVSPQVLRSGDVAKIGQPR